ncbi:hypothetical protein [Pelosinus sp. IPA-1]|uniref:hypothetical protein n=1 Tax=Pelosinus sp. IPA-1 TaxID=3029569 RepID=UPI0024361CF8|nr:hypothetical protein [Pelosinus sp. IPA-1]GMB00644.1 hypothetical protein PIPA1_34430 [Pelosinus sp. IPA-1]
MIGKNGDFIQPFTIEQIKWALRTGKMELLEKSTLEIQPIIKREVNNEVAENLTVCDSPVEQSKMMEIMVNQELSFIKNELTTIIQIQGKQEEKIRLLETEWQKKLIDQETNFLAEMWEMRQSITGEFTTYFEFIVEQLQYQDHVIQEEVKLLKEQLNSLQQSQEYYTVQEKSFAADQDKKIESCQRQLIESMQHFQQILEEIRKQGAEVQKQGKFFFKEIAIVKSDLATLSQRWQSKEMKQTIIEAEACEIDMVQTLRNEGDKNKRRKRNRKGL